MHREIVIVTGGDQNVALPAAVAIHSLLSTKARNTRVCLALADAGIRPRLERWVDRRCRAAGNSRFIWLSPPIRELDSLPHRAALPRTAFLRLLAIRDLPEPIERAVWIDADTIVRRDLTDLVCHELGDATVGAVQEYGTRDLSTAEGTRACFERLGVDGSSRYFNSGVLTIDVRRWRRDRVTERVLDYTRSNAEHVRFADQDGLNMMLAGKWSALDLRWNVQVAAWRCLPRLVQANLAPEVIAAQPGLAADAFIMHFAGDKPWKEGLRSPFRAEYFRALRQSALLNPARYALHRGASYARGLANAGRTRIRAILRPHT